MTCPGHRRSNSKLLGICVTCDLQADTGTAAPAAFVSDLAAWDCTQRQYTAPILLPVYQPRDSFADGGIQPRQASPVGASFGDHARPLIASASASNCAESDSSARTKTSITLASAQA
jgi:hypothetical protein